MSHTRSREMLDLMDAGNDWQQAYDLLLHYEARSWSAEDEDRVTRAQAAEQTAYDAWTFALVAFERAENRRNQTNV